MDALALMHEDPAIQEIRTNNQVLRRNGDTISFTGVAEPRTPPLPPRNTPLVPPPLRLRRQNAIGPTSSGSDYEEEAACTPPRHCCSSHHCGSGTLVADDDEDYSDMPPLIPASQVYQSYYYPSDASTLRAEEPEEGEVFEPIPLSHHMFFDEDGNQITHQEFLKQQEYENWVINLPRLGQTVARHPKALLAFFEFVETLNEFLEPSEQIMLPSISRDLVDFIKSHSAFHDNSLEPYEIVRLNSFLLWHGEVA